MSTKSAQSGDNSKPKGVIGRKKAVLKAVVDNYIQDAIPVSSKKITEKTFTEFSSATIRNDLAHLEDCGYLFHTHVSSGRIPTDKGYRFFVDNFVDNNIQDIKMTTGDKFLELNQTDALERTVQLISASTKLTAIALQNVSKSRIVSDLHLSKLQDSRYVLGIFFDDATIDRVVFSIDEIVGSNELQTTKEEVEFNLGSYISKFKDFLCGRDISKLPTVKINIDLSQEFVKLYTDFFVNLIAGKIQNKTSETNIFLSGTSAITQNNNSLGHIDDSEISSHLLALIEKQMEIASVVQKSLRDKVSATIGSENIVEQMSHHSMVLAPFNNTDSGAIGVIGPTRMDYQNVYGLLSYASKLVSNKQENMEK